MYKVFICQDCNIQVGTATSARTVTLEWSRAVLQTETITQEPPHPGHLTQVTSVDSPCLSCFTAVLYHNWAVSLLSCLTAMVFHMSYITVELFALNKVFPFTALQIWDTYCLWIGGSALQLTNVNYKIRINYLKELLYQRFKNYQKLLVNQSFQKEYWRWKHSQKISLPSLNPYNQLVDICLYVSH